MLAARWAWGGDWGRLVQASIGSMGICEHFLGGAHEFLWVTLYSLRGTQPSVESFKELGVLTKALV